MKTNLKYLLVSFFFIFSISVFPQKSTDKFVVVLDAGHGGKDPGNIGNGYREKNIALKIILLVGKELEKHDNIKVIYTRKTDVYLELHERAAIANKANADLFVSVHCDSWTKSSVFGASTFVLGLHMNKANLEIAKKENSVIFLEENYEEKYEGFDPNSPESLIGLTLMQEDYLDQSILLAKYVQDNFVQKLNRKNRGVKQAGFWVLHNTYMPSILVETGFLTNKSEGAYLNSKKGQEAMAEAIKNGVLSYKNNLSSGSSSVSIVLENPENEEELNSDITFKVQIAAGARKLETKPYNFKGLRGVTSESIGNGYKYFYGETSNYDDIKRHKEEALEKGYTSCFIVAYKNGERIDIKEALKTISN